QQKQVIGDADLAGQELECREHVHEVEEVVAARMCSLWPVTLELDAQRENATAADQARRRGHLLSGDEVDGPELIVGAPPPPIAEPCAQDLERLAGHDRRATPASRRRRPRPS